ncbi:MAG: DNA-binding SARP family transcriptional activator [Saprospiraceae bacterium]|jgi:DNA-binding SARP family transcriptional activator
MDSLRKQLSDILSKRINAPIQVFTLGSFRVVREGVEVNAKDWGRDKAIQLFQFLVTARERRGLHKEQIIDRIWEEVDMKAGEQNFKVAMHGINKALEPNRPSRTDPRFILRQGLTYQLHTPEIWIDADAIDHCIEIGNQALGEDDKLAEEAYREAINLHHGIYLPNRLYEDWSSEERERLQVLALGAIITLAELELDQNPMESVRLASQAIQIDAAWEDAYRVQMQAYLNKGNRPMAIKTYRNCLKVLEEEFGIEPLPETQRLFREIQGK